MCDWVGVVEQTKTPGSGWTLLELPHKEVGHTSALTFATTWLLRERRVVTVTTVATLPTPVYKSIPKANLNQFCFLLLQNGVTHRDLKLENILLNENNYPKVSNVTHS